MGKQAENVVRHAMVISFGKRILIPGCFPPAVVALAREGSTIWGAGQPVIPAKVPGKCEI
jgi:hypothetical protein